MSRPAAILSGKKFKVLLDRLCYQLIENHGDFSQSALIGLQPRGIFLSTAIYDRLGDIIGVNKLSYGKLDATFHRDDFRRHKGPLIPSKVDIDFSIEDKKVILVDDVLYTGRTIRAGLDALLDYGRPDQVELLVLVDRRYSRQLPIEPDYVGLTVDTRASQKVKVVWTEDVTDVRVWLLSDKDE